MANKNPSMKTGNRKRKNAKLNITTTPVQKTFCSRFMIRYSLSENSVVPGYDTFWVCRMCMACILKKEAVQSHIDRCKVEFKKRTTVNEPVITEESQDIGYICKICNDVFRRKVILKKHMEKHDNTSDSETE